jgi:hypothetical protein
MALSELSRREKAAPRFVRLRSADMESRVRLDEYVADQTLADFGEPIAKPSPESFIVFDASSIEPYLKLRSGVKVSERRGAIIHTLLSSPDKEATPYWREFMARNAERIVRFARTATNKGMNVDSSFK